MASRRDPIFGPLLILVVVAAAIAWALWPQPKPSDAGSPVPTTFTPQAPTVPPPPRNAADVADELRNGQPVTVQVFADSTGNDRYEWVYQWARIVGRRFHRTVQISTIDPATFAYPAPETITTGTGPPVTIWNASLPGYDPAREVALFGKLARATNVDLLFLDHGHNGVESALWDDLNALTEKARARWPNTAVVVIAQNPDTKGAAAIAQQRQAVADVKAWAKVAHYELADVFAAFGPDPAMYTLPDGIHPNEAGGRLWGQTVAKLFPA